MSDENTPETELLSSIRQQDSRKAEESGLIISIPEKDFAKNETVKLTVGFPGIPNVSKSLSVGETIIFDAGIKGTYEVRLLSMFHGSDGDDKANVSVTKIM